MIANTKKLKRLRRARKTRAHIKTLAVHRLSVNRSNKHIAAQLISPCGKTLASVSTMQSDVVSQIKNGSNKQAAEVVGQAIAKRASQLGVSNVAFDRSGYKFHGRVKALIDAARQAGL